MCWQAYDHQNIKREKEKDDEHKPEAMITWYPDVGDVFRKLVKMVLASFSPFLTEKWVNLAQTIRETKEIGEEETFVLEIILISWM